MAELVDNWWAFIVRGIFAMLFGIAAVSWPGLTILLLVVFFGAYVLVDGVVSLVSAFGNRNWLWYLLAGLVGIAAGGIALTRPGITALAFALLIGIWAIARGIVEIITAIQLRKEIEGEFFLILAGAVSVLFGLYVTLRPGAGALAIVWIIAFYAWLEGVLAIALGLKFRKLKKEVEAVAAAPAMGA